MKEGFYSLRVIQFAKIWFHGFGIRTLHRPKATYPKLKNLSSN